jgi:hypothetical protein
VSDNIGDVAAARRLQSGGQRADGRWGDPGGIGVARDLVAADFRGARLTARMKPGTNGGPDSERGEWA